MAFSLYLIIFSLLEGGKNTYGIKFSAESFAEISLLAKNGRTHLEALREKENTPQFGPCWRDAISDLQIGCKFLSENVQSDLALRFTDCFLQMSGHEPLTCDFPRSACLKKLSDRAFIAYTEFYTHTQSICYFLQSQIWHEETEKTIDKLSLTSLQVSQKLEKAGEIQEKLLSQQRESLSLQHNLNNSSRNIASVLQSSQDKINVFIRDFEITTSEQKELLVGLFENLVLFRTWAVNELSWFSSTVYFATATIITFLFTSVSRTREARIILLLILTINYFFERLLASSSLSNVFLGGYVTVTPESLSTLIWLCRKFCICLGIAILLYTACSYSDYNALNYQLLLEIRTQNSKILNQFAMQVKNQSNISHAIHKSNLKEIGNAFDHSCVSPKPSSSSWTVTHTNDKNRSRLYNSQMYSGRVFESFDIFTRDVVDCEESKPLDKVSVTCEKENVPEVSKHIRYNLRNYKSRKTVIY